MRSSKVVSVCIFNKLQAVGLFLAFDSTSTHIPIPFSLVPRLSQNANMYRGESLVHVSFLRKHDVIKIKKAKFCTLFNQLSFNTWYV